VDTSWEDLKHSDYRSLLEEAKRQLKGIQAQIEGIHRISNAIIIKNLKTSYTKSPRTFLLR